MVFQQIPAVELFRARVVLHRTTHQPSFLIMDFPIYLPGLQPPQTLYDIRKVCSLSIDMKGK